VAERLTILWTGPALEDLEEIRVWVARDRPVAARRLAARIRERVEALAAFPTSGRVVPELGGDRYREVVVRPYRVVYEVLDDAVIVIRVWHARRPLGSAQE